MKTWILTGDERNWAVAISDRIWGVKEGRLKNCWNKLEKGDVLFFYAKSPIKGLIGLGIVDSKFKQDKPLWPDEIRAKQVLYPYRFGFNIIYCLPVPESWQENRIGVSDLSLPNQAGLNSLSRINAINEIFLRIKDKWNVEMPQVMGEKVTVSAEKLSPPLVDDGISLHNQIRDKLYHIGQLQNFISEKEYPIDGERLDVTWRKVVRGVPTKSFEVQVGGSIHQALAKLKHAWDLWNSEPYLIIDPKHQAKTDELLSGTFHEMKPVIRVVTVDRVEELYNHLISDRKLLEEFGL